MSCCEAEKKLAEIEEYCRQHPRATHPKRIIKRWFSDPPTPSLPVVNVTPPAPAITTFDGHGRAQHGIFWGAWEMETGKPRVFERIHAMNHAHDNARVMAWKDGEALPVSPRVTIVDCTFENAAAKPPKSLDGTGESNLWVGCTAQVCRVVLRSGAWMGLWTGGDSGLVNGGCFSSIFEDMLLENQRIAIYIEHVTAASRFSRFKATASEIGVNVEWWYDGRGSKNCVIEDFDITITGDYPDNDRRGWGISLDAGTYGFKIRNGIIRGGKGIELPRRLADSKYPNVVENVVRPDGSPVPIVYHDRPIG